MLLPVARPPGDPGGTISTIQGHYSLRLSGVVAVANAISQVNDLTANADHAVQATGGDQPTLDAAKAPGTSSIKFSQTDHLEITPNGAVRAIALNVYVPATLTGERVVVARAGTVGSNPAFYVTIA